MCVFAACSSVLFIWGESGMVFVRLLRLGEGEEVRGVFWLWVWEGRGVELARG